MAIEEHDREDLLRDGRKMPVRGETVLNDATMLIGFRQQGQASLYDGAERVFQFDLAGQLRRAYLDGRKYAASSGKLVQLCRQSRGGRIELIRQDVDDETMLTIVGEIGDSLNRLSTVIADSESKWRIVGVCDADFRDQVTDWLEIIPSPIQIGASPNA